jgi:hypothetical protein
MAETPKRERAPNRLIKIEAQQLTHTLYLSPWMPNESVEKAKFCLFSK